MPKPKYYAVANGRVPGIYETWELCKSQVDGHRNAKFKSFPTRSEAQHFISTHASSLAPVPTTRTTTDVTPIPTSSPLPTPPLLLKRRYSATSRRPSKQAKLDIDLNSSDFSTADISTMTSIYTDGSSLNNGSDGAVAGYGIYFGPGDVRNSANRLAGPKQTNQRAELTAIVKALTRCPEEEDVAIHTDSQYSINCFTVWHHAWSKNGWKNSKKQPVENRDLIQAGLDIMASRKGKTRLIKVKAHVGILGNEMADRLANEGAMKPQSEEYAVKYADGRKTFAVKHEDQTISTL